MATERGFLFSASFTVVNSRYSIVMATSKRARQLVNGRPTTVKDADSKKPLSVAIEELEKGDIKIVSEE